MMTRRTLALLVVLALGFVLLTATTSSARNTIEYSSNGSGACGQVVFRDDDGGDDDRWGNADPEGDEGDDDVPEPPEEDGGEGEGEGEGGEGNAMGRQLSMRLATFYAQFRFAFMHMKYILATL